MIAEWRSLPPLLDLRGSAIFGSGHLIRPQESVGSNSRRPDESDAVSDETGLSRRFFVRRPGQLEVALKVWALYSHVPTSPVAASGRCRTNDCSSHTLQVMTQ